MGNKSNGRWPGWRATLFVALAATGLAAADVHEQCPVVPANRALAEHSVIHMGKTVRFCCADCLEKFLDNPEKYLPEPEAQARRIGAAPARPSWLELAEDAGVLFVRHRGLSLYALFLSLAFLVARRWQQRRGQPAALFHSANLLVLILLGCLVDTVRVYALRPEVSAASPPPGSAATDQAGNYLQFFTHQADLDDQEIKEARDQVPCRLHATYYRGNDERNPRLFNQGLYCTCTLRIGLCAADGEPIQHGDDVSGRELFVELEIVRTPRSAASFFSDAAMASVFLAHQRLSWERGNEPGPFEGEEVRLTIVESAARWRARLPLGAVKTKSRGVIYLCQNGQVSQRVTTLTPHYGIGYRLAVKDGKLEPVSHMWLAALYYTNRELDGWFSHKPLPIIPEESSATLPASSP